MSKPPKQRRGNGEGSIYWREDRGCYCGQIEVSGRRKTLYGKTKAEIQRKILQARVAADQGLVVTPARITMEKFLTDWLRDVVEHEGSYRTHEAYSYHVRCHLIPAIGAVKLRDLTTLQLQALYRQLLDRGLKPKTVRNAHGVIRKALTQAVDWKLVSHNVALAAKLPKYVPPEHETLSPAEVKRVWRAVAGTRWHAFLVLLVMTGLRQGEILGLRWADLDLEGKVLQVRRQLQRDKSFRTTKGSRSRRLDLSDREVTTLKAHRALQEQERSRAGGAYEDQELVFATRQGRPLMWRNVSRRFKEILAVAGVKEISFHESRHTNATIALQKGIPAKVVQERLGHSDIGVTLNTYSHVTPGLGRAAASKLSEAFEDEA